MRPGRSWFGVACLIAVLGVGWLARGIFERSRGLAPAWVAGTWSTGPDYTGTWVKLRQDGKRVAGEGKFWSCVGGQAFKVTGELEGRRLRLEFAGTRWKKEDLFFVVDGDNWVHQNPVPRVSRDETGAPVFYIEDLWKLDFFTRARD